ncbi:MAG TPA: hypothetical protein DCO72_01575 [Ruminococcus sp.]|nr:hypothetical protein [Ruminococcus sp.]
MKFIRNKSVNELTEEEMRVNFSATEIDEKQKILKYMKSFSKPFAFTSQPVIDKFTNKETEKINNAFSDGEYTWYVSEIYHFEKYNLILNSDFIEYVLNRSN